MLGLGYGSFTLGFGVSFWQALIAGAVGIVLSFLLCGFVALAGKRGSAPTMVLGRAAFGVRGNGVPAVLSWVLTVGWETALTILATLATATVFDELGWSSGTATKVIALIVVAALTILGGVMGFDLIMRLQAVITVVTGVLTVVYIVLVLDKIHWSTVSALPSGSAQETFGCFVFVLTGFGLGWVNAAADYSRYLPRRSSSGGVVVVDDVRRSAGAGRAAGVRAAARRLVQDAEQRDRQRSDRRAGDAAEDLGAGAVPHRCRARPGRRRRARHLLVRAGPADRRIAHPAAAAALVDGVIMVAGSVYVVFVAKTSFLFEFEGFLITLGVPIAAWCGIFLADLVLRRRDYAEARSVRPARAATASASRFRCSRLSSGRCSAGGW